MKMNLHPSISSVHVEKPCREIENIWFFQRSISGKGIPHPMPSLQAKDTGLTRLREGSLADGKEKRKGWRLVQILPAGRTPFRAAERARLFSRVGKVRQDWGRYGCTWGSAFFLLSLLSFAYIAFLPAPQQKYYRQLSSFRCCNEEQRLVQLDSRCLLSQSALLARRVSKGVAEEQRLQRAQRKRNAFRQGYHDRPSCAFLN